MVRFKINQCFAPMRLSFCHALNFYKHLAALPQKYAAEQQNVCSQ